MFAKLRIVNSVNEVVMSHFVLDIWAFFDATFGEPFVANKVTPRLNYQYALDSYQN